MLPPLPWRVSVSARTLASQGIGFLDNLKNPANLFKNNLNNKRNNMKSQIQNNINNNNKNIIIIIIIIIIMVELWNY